MLRELSVKASLRSDRTKHFCGNVPASHCVPTRHARTTGGIRSQLDTRLPSLRAQIVHTPAMFYLYTIQAQGAHNKGLSMSCDNMTAKISGVASSIC